ncbi:heme NO-binding domain-containing protein [Chitinibacter bivalviorum]|uniref:Heme NO-binding domain-containing protein n=1 Tax=Chitinibacter bivalviorum TaxID=2739434 RepID=A0A7H9BGQ8_9NEIS|nr:heme NO-binding domain-containing protein [Chitinibacter bivalviorum]QLG87775.1 heme NO-binding domain-containing protein [Chitinibacter bivalviorum]
MYGVVNKTLQEMVCAKYGESSWQQILHHIGMADEIFLSSEAYPDATTYALVGATSAITDLPAEQLLEQFGRYWVMETGQRSYGHLLKAGGDNLQDFLVNLPNFHARIFLIYPNLQPPEFLCMPEGNHKVIVKYYSHRPGLAPFVIGLLKGVGELFETTVTVVQTQARQTQSDFDEFLVEWG